MAKELTVVIKNLPPFSHYVRHGAIDALPTDPSYEAVRVAARDAFVNMPVLNSLGHDVVKPS